MSKIKMLTQYDVHDRHFAEAGRRVKTLYGPIYDDRGVLNLTEVGKHDLYAEIQSHRDSVDIHVLLKRYQQGDVEALSRVQGAYGDFTDFPRTYAEALNNIIGAEQYFMGLPAEVRARYNNSFSQFLASMDSPTFARDIGLVTDKPDDLLPKTATYPPSPGTDTGEGATAPGSGQHAGNAGATPDTLIL